jgi:hypothetical protein
MEVQRHQFDTPIVIKVFGITFFINVERKRREMTRRRPGNSIKLVRLKKTVKNTATKKKKKRKKNQKTKKKTSTYVTDKGRNGPKSKRSVQTIDGKHAGYKKTTPKSAKRGRLGGCHRARA